MTENDQENEKIIESKNELFYNRNKPKYDGSFLFSVMDREYDELSNLPEVNHRNSSLSTLIYVIGAIIFLMGTLEGFAAAQIAKTSSISSLHLSGIGLLTAFIVGIVFITFGKVIELIIYRSNHK